MALTPSDVRSRLDALRAELVSSGPERENEIGIVAGTMFGLGVMLMADTGNTEYELVELIRSIMTLRKEHHADDTGRIQPGPDR